MSSIDSKYLHAVRNSGIMTPPRVSGYNRLKSPYQPEWSVHNPYLHSDSSDKTGIYNFKDIPDLNLSCDFKMDTSLSHDQIMTILRKPEQTTSTYVRMIDQIFEETDLDIKWQNINTDRLEGLVCTTKTWFDHYEFKIGDQLGKGGFGSVHKMLVYDNENGKESWKETDLVIKCINNQKSVQDEDYIIKLIGHQSPCCVVRQKKFGDISDENGNREYGVYIMEKVDGDLNDFSESILGSENFKSMLKDNPYIFQDIVLHTMDRVKSKFACLFDNGWRYFDIKPDNIGYKIQDDEFRIVILDIGSMAQEDCSEYMPTRTYYPPEWRKEEEDIRRTSLKDPSGCTKTIHSTYVWFISFNLLLMFESHPTYGKDARRTVRNVHQHREDWAYEEAQDLLKKIFPPNIYGDIHTGLHKDPEERKIQLSETWCKCTSCKKNVIDINMSIVTNE